MNKEGPKELQKIEAKKDAEYCLNCKIKPCSQKGCPLNNDIPAFIEQIKNENYEEAYNILSKTTVLPAICGRICPHYKQCMGSCIRGIKSNPVNIGNLEKYIGDWALNNIEDISEISEQHGRNSINNAQQGFSNTTETICSETKSEIQNKKIAIVGGGPAGLTCAAFLAKKGHEVTIYEKYNYLGGLLVHGIPEFRLPREITNKTINSILKLGINIEYNKELGKNINIEDLKKENDFIVLAFGANNSSKMGIQGENLKGVYGGNELLEYKLHPDYKNKTVIINGGGNVAMDVARTVKRMGAKKVIVTYRRSKEEMPAEPKEIEDAISEGVEFLFQHNIVKIIGDISSREYCEDTSMIEKYDNTSKKALQESQKIKNMKELQNTDEEIRMVRKIELIKTKLIKKEGENRRYPENIEGSNYTIPADYVIMAIGSHTADFVKNLGLEVNKYGNIKVDENGKTSNPKIYAIGDLAGNKATVAWAARSGRDVAEALT